MGSIGPATSTAKLLEFLIEYSLGKPKADSRDLVDEHGRK